MKKPLLILFAFMLAGGIFIAYQLNAHFQEMEIDTENILVNESTREQMNTSFSASDTGTGNVEHSKPERTDFYTLIIGMDFREDQLMLNTDSLMVAHVIPDKSMVKLVSLPRDTRVENSRGEAVKINSVFSEGYWHAVREGRKDPDLLSGNMVKMGQARVPEEYVSSGMVELRETVEQFLQLNIDYTFLVNFQTVISLVDAVGGIEVDVERSMHYDAEFDNTHIHLEKGLQTLNGQDALNYARFRLDNRGPEYYSNDFERGIRQQKVVSALVDKLASWKSLPRLLDLTEIVSSNTKTDMKRSTMVSLIQKYYRNLRADSVITLPFEGYWESPYVWISDEKLNTLVRELKSTKRPEPESGTNGDIQNATAPDANTKQKISG